MTSLVILPTKVDELNLDEILQKHLPSNTISGTQGLLGLQPLCNQNQELRDQLIACIEANYSIHAFNSAALKDIMKIDLGGVKTLIYYHELEKESPNLRGFLQGIDWSNAHTTAHKDAVIKFFGIKNPGPVDSIKIQQTRHKADAEAYKMEGEGWQFTIQFSLHWHKINKVPTMGAGFDGDLGRLAFFE